jgi:hypothetical protein
MSRFYGAAAVYARLLLAMVPSVLPLTAGAMQQPGLAPGAGAPACSAVVLSQTRLVVEDGREVYIEPIAMVPSGEEILLAGVPNYVWTRRGARGPVVAFAANSVLGVVIGADGRGRLVPSPVQPKRVRALRAAARSDGGWDVVFAELAPTDSLSTDDALPVRLWHGVLHHGGWSELHQIPQPLDARVRLSNASALISRGDTLAFVSRVETPTQNTEAVVHFRRAGRWSFELVRTRPLSYAAIGVSESRGWMLVAVRGDTVPPRENALFVYRRAGNEWQLVRKMDGDSDPAHQPTLDLDGHVGVLSWWAMVSPADGSGRREARAIARVEHGATKIATIDSSTSYVALAGAIQGAVRLWVTEHVESMAQPSELRFVAFDGEQVAILGRMPSPYLGFFAATVSKPSQVVVAGPLAELETTTPTVVTLLIRARVRCLAGARRPP